MSNPEQEFLHKIRELEDAISLSRMMSILLFEYHEYLVEMLNSGGGTPIMTHTLGLMSREDQEDFCQRKNNDFLKENWKHFQMNGRPFGV